MTQTEQQTAAKNFSEEWKDRGDEKQETQRFWIGLLADVLGVPQATSYIEFEKRVKLSHTSFIDGYIPETKVLIEQKSIDIDLEKSYAQSDGTMLTPYQQAKRYASELPYDLRPRWIVVSNFAEIRIHDMNHPEDEPEILKLENLEKEYYRLEFLADRTSEKIRREEEISIKAGELVKKLYNALITEYAEQTAESLRSLNILCVRLVFCFYAEDAGLFATRTSFEDYIKSFNLQNVRKGLIDLFKALDTELKDRDKYDETIKPFPYVNGGLFKDEKIEIPNFTQEIVDVLVNDCAVFDWSEISPTIFGAVFESTLNPQTRRSGGMHYTSVENIHKVIDPLFMDSLNAEFESIQKITQKKNRDQKLLEFQDKLASLMFLDPACGSGNFLTEAFLSLRRLENKVISSLFNGETVLGFDEFIKVKISQFYGIEINDFAVTVAKTALWIAESQMIAETEKIVSRQIDFLPLKTNAYIVEGNALRMNWKTLKPEDGTNLPQDGLFAGITTHVDGSEHHYDYIMGNPPFVGYSLQSESQKSDILNLFVDENGKVYKAAGKIDYVSGWYWKAAQLIQNTNIKCALVSTNSITQGEQVAALWKTIFERFNIHFDFAYRTFRWDSESTQKAHVHCVIIGFSSNSHSELDSESPKFIIDEDGTKIEVKNINGYLLDADNVWIDSRSKPLCSVPEMISGGKPVEGGFLIFTESEKQEFVNQEPDSEKYFRHFISSDDYINNHWRWCLWLVDCSPKEMRAMPKVMERIEKVKEFRLSSVKEATRKYAEIPYQFMEIKQPDSDYLLIPATSSENRRYIPIGFVEKNVIANNAASFVPNASLYHFGILTSSVHMAWMRAVCGRLEMRYRYSVNVVYNNFPWPDLVISDQGLGIKGGELYDNKFQRVDCLAEGNGLDRGNLSNYKKASERGNIRTFRPDEARCSVDSVEHSGRTWQEFNEGIYTVSGNCEGGGIRTGNTVSSMRENKIHDGIRSSKRNKSAERNSENNQFDDNKTQKQKLTPNHYSIITKTAQAILDARAKYPDSSLADLYDETVMPPELRKAHQENDRAVMQAYGFTPKMTESEIVAELFKIYERLTKGE